MRFNIADSSPTHGEARIARTLDALRSCVMLLSQLDENQIYPNDEDMREDVKEVRESVRDICDEWRALN